MNLTSDIWNIWNMNETCEIKANTSFYFYKQRYFSTQPQCCWTFSWNELQMLLRCCLIHLTIVILRHILYLAYLCRCLGLDLFMPYLYDLLFIFSLIFIFINHITSFKKTYFFLYILKMSPRIIKCMKEANNFQIDKVQHQGVA